MSLLKKLFSSFPSLGLKGMPAIHLCLLLLLSFTPSSSNTGLCELPCAFRATFRHPHVCEGGVPGTPSSLSLHLDIFYAQGTNANLRLERMPLKIPWYLESVSSR